MKTKVIVGEEETRELTARRRACTEERKNRNKQKDYNNN